MKQPYMTYVMWGLSWSKISLSGAQFHEAKWLSEGHSKQRIALYFFLSLLCGTAVSNETV
jgi:hypothetical protein